MECKPNLMMDDYFNRISENINSLYKNGQKYDNILIIKDNMKRTFSIQYNKNIY